MTVSAYTALRLQLLANGYAPIPVDGKRPPLKDWQKKINPNAEEIELWEKTYPYAENTGILTAITPTLDIDIKNPEAAEAIEGMVSERFEECGYVLVRVGQAPKRAIPFRTDTAFKKIAVNITAPNGDTEQKIELLAAGQQVVVDGIHPDTGQRYSWHSGDPSSIKHEDLPYITETEARQLVEDAAALLKEKFGYSLPKARPEKDAPKGDVGGGAEDWGYLLDNIRLGRELHDTLRDLAGKLITSGMSEGAAVNFLRGQMERSEAPHDERWHERCDDVARLVKGAAQWKASTAPCQRVGDKATLLSSCAANITPKRIDFLWPGRIARGKHTAIAGEAGDGKSQLSVYVAATISRGGAWPCNEGRAPIGNVIIFNAEDAADDTVVPRLMAAGADLKRVHIVNAVLQEDGKGRRTFNLQADLVLLERKIAEIGDVVLVIIDPISSYMGKTDSHKNAEVRGALEPLSEMAARLNVAILSITHFSKSGAGVNTKALHRFIGSIAFVGAPRAAFAAIQDPDNEGRILFLHAKNNMARKQQGLAYRLVQTLVGKPGKEQDILASYIVWENEPVVMSADEALRATEDGGDRKALAEAVEFLQDRLSSGAVVPAKEAEEHARALGITPRTLRRARKKLGVIPEKSGLNEGWTWRLPPEGGQGTPKMSTTNIWPPSDKLAAFEEGQPESKLAAFEEGQKIRRWPNNSTGPLQEELAAFEDTLADGHNIAPASEPMPADVTTPKRSGRPPLALKAPSQDAPSGQPPEPELPSRPRESAPAPSRTPDDDIPAFLRRCFRCNGPGDDDRGDVTIGRDGQWRHAVCHLLEGTTQPHGQSHDVPLSP
jgi:hypothetical protein